MQEKAQDDGALRRAYARIELLEREIAARRAFADGRHVRSRAAIAALVGAIALLLLSVVFATWVTLAQTREAQTRGAIEDQAGGTGGKGGAR